MKIRHAAPIASLAVAVLVGCDLAPVYDPPHYVLPASYQGSEPFEVAQPQEALLPRGNWRALLGEERLNEPEGNWEHSNPTLQAAAETYTQARDLAAEAESRLYPQLGAQALVSDNRQSAHHLFSSGPGPNEEASNLIGGAASWEPDFW